MALSIIPLSQLVQQSAVTWHSVSSRCHSWHSMLQYQGKQLVQETTVPRHTAGTADCSTKARSIIPSSHCQTPKTALPINVCQFPAHNARNKPTCCLPTFELQHKHGAVLEQRMHADSTKKFLAFCSTRRFINVFARARHWYLP
jgi:hypothetical protein